MRLIAEYRVLNTDQLTFLAHGTKRTVQHRINVLHKTYFVSIPHSTKCWLKQPITREKTYKYAVEIRTGENTPLKTFVWLSGIRWAIEQSFEEMKSELGMDHYEVRKLPGWKHHMLTSILAHFFLRHLKIRLGEKSIIYYFVAA